MDNSEFLLRFSDAFTRSWNIPYPSEGVQQEYFCPNSYYSEFNFTQQPLITNPESHSPEDLQPKHYVQLDPFCQEFNFVQGHSTAIPEVQFDSQNVPEFGNTSDTSCSPTLSPRSGDLLASAVSQIEDLGDFYEDLCSSEPSFASEVEVTTGPVAAGVQFNQEMSGFQVHIERGKDIKAPPFSVIQFLSILFDLLNSKLNVHVLFVAVLKRPEQTVRPTNNKKERQKTTLPGQVRDGHSGAIRGSVLHPRPRVLQESCGPEGVGSFLPK